MFFFAKNVQGGPAPTCDRRPVAVAPEDEHRGPVLRIYVKTLRHFRRFNIFVAENIGTIDHHHNESLTRSAAIGPAALAVLVNGHGTYFKQIATVAPLGTGKNVPCARILCLHHIPPQTSGESKVLYRHSRKTLLKQNLEAVRLVHIMARNSSLPFGYHRKKGEEPGNSGSGSILVALPDDDVKVRLFSCNQSAS